MLQGIIEIDETFVGGIETNKHESKKLKAGRGTVGKTAVLGMRERGGRTVAMPINGPIRKRSKPRFTGMSRSDRPCIRTKPARTLASATSASTTIRSIIVPANMSATT